MRVYVQGRSALAYYRGSYAGGETARCSKSVLGLEHATSSYAFVMATSWWRLGVAEPSQDEPLEVLVKSASQRSRSRAVRARVWGGKIADRAFRKVDDELYVSSPEFVFLQMATVLAIPQLAALGMELCGTYRREVRVSALGTGEDAWVTVYQQFPLTTPRRIRGFLARMKGAPGQSRALAALRYVLPDSASPMETAILLLLCLPRRLGGYALPLPVFNPPITFSRAGRRHTLRNSAKPDLYWKKAKLDLEYDSDEFHSTEKLAISSMRRKALERMGVEVIGLTKDEVESVELFHATALRIARCLGKEIRAEDENRFASRRMALREAVLEENDEKFDVTGGVDAGEGHCSEEREGIDAIPDESWYYTDWFPDDEDWVAEIVDDEEADGFVYGARGRG